jgi:chaperonin GroEL
VALIRAEQAVDVDALGLTGDEATGALIVKHALSEPARLIASNAGHEGAVVVERIRSESGATGFNAATGEWGDLTKSGVIDPAKVTRSALENAASVAGLLLTTETVITDLPEKERAMGMPPGGMGGGMDF